MPVTDRVGHQMKLHDLNVLMTVVQTGSMLKAAERLNTVQPAISRSIAELEHTLGVRLLDRHRKGVEPTGYGRALLDCGATVFDALRQGVENIELLADPEAGEVRIGSGFHLAPSFVSAAVVDRLSRRYPRIVFHLVTENQTEQLHRELHERAQCRSSDRAAIDLVSDERLDFESINNAYYVVAGAKHPLARRRRIEPAELVSKIWVLPPPGIRLGRTQWKPSAPTGSTIRVRPFSPFLRRADRVCWRPDAFSRFLELRIAISNSAPGTQGLARQAAIGPRAARHHHPEESDAQSRRGALY